VVKQALPDLLYKLVFRLDNRKVENERKVTNVLLLLQNIGGFIQAIMLLFNFLLMPISETDFYLDLAKNLYQAKVEDPSFFRDSSPTNKSAK
jgi:hypothetical protein